VRLSNHRLSSLSEPTLPWTKRKWLEILGCGRCGSSFTYFTSASKNVQTRFNQHISADKSALYIDSPAWEALCSMAVNDLPTNAFEDLFASKREDLLKNLGDMNVPLEKYSLYFAQLKRICHKISETECQQISAKSGTEVLACMEELFTTEDFSNSLRSNLRRKLRDKFYLLKADGTNGAPQEGQKTADPNVSDEHINNTISLILHILLTISVRRVKRFVLGGETTWNDTGTLKEFVDSQFPAARTADSEPKRNGAIDRTFTAANLWKKREIKIVPTYDLRDHLSFARTKRTKWLRGTKGTVQIYPLRRWLDLHQFRYLLHPSSYQT
jgi:hypothetical protein